MVVGLSEVLAGHADACACWIRAGLAALNVPQYGRSIVLRNWTCACDLLSSGPEEWLSSSCLLPARRTPHR